MGSGVRDGASAAIAFSAYFRQQNATASVSSSTFPVFSNVNVVIRARVLEVAPQRATPRDNEASVRFGRSVRGPIYTACDVVGCITDW